jgi:hypothetical protein
VAGLHPMGVSVIIYLVDQRCQDDLVLPAYREFFATHNTGALIRLLETAKKRLESLPVGDNLAFDPPEVYDEAIAILSGKQYYSSEGRKPASSQDRTSRSDMEAFVKGSVGPDLLKLLCLPRDLGLSPQQGMSGTGLMRYLYSQSRWIEDYFTFSKEVSGPVSGINIGEWSRYFSSEQLQAFDHEMSKMREPKDRAAKSEFDNLQKLVHVAATDPSYKLLLVIS